MTNLLVRVVLYLWVLLALVPTGAVSSSSSKSSKVSSFSSKSKTSLPHKRKKTAKVHSVVLSKRSSKLKSSTTSKSRKSASVPKKGSKHTVACSDGFHKASSKGGDLEAFAFDACELFRGDSDGSMSMPPSPAPSRRVDTDRPSVDSGPPTNVDSGPPMTTPTVAPSTLIVGTPLPTVAPTLAVETCTAHDGVWGLLEGDLQVVSYGYELETVPSTTENQLITEVLPALEEAFTQFLLPVLAVEECGSRRKLLDVPVVSLGRTGNRRLQVSTFVGISSRPDDVVVEGLACFTPNRGADNQCRLMYGELSLYFNDTTGNEVRRGRTARFLDENEDLVRQALKGGMEDDEFLYADDRIVRVTYVDDIDTIINDINGGSDLEASNGVVVGWVVAATVAGALLVGAAAYKRRRHQQEAAGDDKGHLEIEDNHDLGEDPHDSPTGISGKDTHSLVSTDADELKDAEALVLTAHE